jgi:hypothetical protein
LDLKPSIKNQGGANALEFPERQSKRHPNEKPQGGKVVPEPIAHANPRKVEEQDSPAFLRTQGQPGLPLQTYLDRVRF